jgi:hypothetical protein
VKGFSPSLARAGYVRVLHISYLLYQWYSLLCALRSVLIPRSLCIGSVRVIGSFHRVGLDVQLNDPTLRAMQPEISRVSQHLIIRAQNDVMSARLCRTAGLLSALSIYIYILLLLLFLRCYCVGRAFTCMYGCILSSQRYRYIFFLESVTCFALVPLRAHIGAIFLNPRELTANETAPACFGTVHCLFVVQQPCIEAEPSIDRRPRGSYGSRQAHCEQSVG